MLSQTITPNSVMLCPYEDCDPPGQVCGGGLGEDGEYGCIDAEGACEWRWEICDYGDGGGGGGGDDPGGGGGFDPNGPTWADRNADGRVDCWKNLTAMPSATRTSAWGWRFLNGKWDFHDGIDIAVPVGTYVYASSRGVVAEAGYSQYNGNYVAINNDDGTQSVYIHLSTNVALPQIGTRLYPGDLVAASGNTPAVAAHLHFTLWPTHGGRAAHGEGGVT